MVMARGHIQEIKNDVGLTVAWRAFITHPTKLTRSGSGKRLSAQFSVGPGVSSAKAKREAEGWLDMTRSMLREGKDVVTKSSFSVSDTADAWLASIEVEGEQGKGKL